MRLLLTALSLVLAAVLSAQTTTAKFDTKMIKRDPVEEGTPQGYRYGVTNTGDVPLYFDAVDVTCECYEVTLPLPLMPGESGAIIVVFNTEDMVGFHRGEVVVYGNVKKPVSLQFQVQVFEEGADTGGG